MKRVRRRQQVKHSGIPMMGTISMVIRDAKTRRVKRRLTIRNKITYLAADVLVELIAQRTTDPAPAQDLVYSLRVGTSNTAASRSDINLGSFVFGTALVDVNKITGGPGELSFVATLESGDANGVTLAEAGLFTAGVSPSVSNSPGINPGDTRMIARQVYPGIPKTSAIVIDYSWTISFTAVP